MDTLTKSQVTKLVVDLCWDYDRMSSSGQETLDNLWLKFIFKSKR